jgi:hypothetical protein
MKKTLAGSETAWPVEVSARDSSVLVKAIGDPRLTLAQKLAAFDPALHGGEAMAYPDPLKIEFSPPAGEAVPGLSPAPSVDPRAR